MDAASGGVPLRGDLLRHRPSVRGAATGHGQVLVEATGLDLVDRRAVAAQRRDGLRQAVLVEQVPGAPFDVEEPARPVGVP
ncbi:hypothetical protein BJF79_04750 [Actinomadura sp. CNU-125]|nr:hypothetical protein BJF79_04750 [Actinomadura sp. CNU-125]